MLLEKKLKKKHMKKVFQSKFHFDQQIRVRGLFVFCYFLPQLSPGNTEAVWYLDSFTSITTEIVRDTIFNKSSIEGVAQLNEWLSKTFHILGRKSRIFSILFYVDIVPFEAFKWKLDVSTLCEITQLTIGLSLAETCPNLFKCW